MCCILFRRNSNSAKVQKAKELGIEVITERHFNELVGRFFQIDGTNLVWYLGDGSEVTIPTGITSINGFSYRESLTSVTIPAGVTSIEAGAFYKCKSLRGVVLPDSVTSIGTIAFCWCNSMEYLAIPKSVTSIGLYAFDECPNLTIHAPAGSYAEQYAKEHGIPFVAED